MSEKEPNTPDISEFEAKSFATSTNKDLWLFLIIIDVIFLCVFGFFLYKNLSAKLLSPSTDTPAVVSVSETVVVEEEPVLPTDMKAEKIETPLVVEEIKVPQPEIAKPVKEPVKEQAKPVVTEKEPVAQVAAQIPAEKKESVSVQVNPKSKYRQVTFRYFGDAKEVAVVSGFTMSKPRAMTKKDGVWETTLSIAPGNYKYLFVVDGKNTTDPYAEQKDGRSLLVLE